MSRQFDYITLSAYVDGELDPDTMREVEGFLASDANARKHVVNAIRTTVLLRKSANDALHKKVPERLVTAILSQRKNDLRRKTAIYHLFRIAAAIILVLLGFGAGNLLQSDGEAPLQALGTPLPASFRRVVNEALENNRSGISRQWREPQMSAVVTVTPVKTYRDKNGLYFREYYLEVTDEAERKQISGLAYRSSTGQWETKALFY